MYAFFVGGWGAPQVAGQACAVLAAALTDPFPEAKRECCSLLLRLAAICPGGLRSRLGKVGICGWIFCRCCLSVCPPLRVVSWFEWFERNISYSVLAFWSKARNAPEWPFCVLKGLI